MSIGGRLCTGGQCGALDRGRSCASASRPQPTRTLQVRWARFGGTAVGVISVSLRVMWVLTTVHRIRYTNAYKRVVAEGSARVRTSRRVLRERVYPSATRARPVP